MKTYFVYASFIRSPVTDGVWRTSLYLPRQIRRALTRPEPVAALRVTHIHVPRPIERDSLCFVHVVWRKPNGRGT